MKPRQPVRRVNHKRLAKRRAEQFGPKADWIRTQRCFVSFYHCVHRDDFVDAIDCTGTIEAMHALSRGAGGDAGTLVPCCSKHHREFHNAGQVTTARKYGVSLNMAADLYEAMWRLQGEA